MPKLTTAATAIQVDGNEKKPIGYLLPIGSDITIISQSRDLRFGHLWLTVETSDGKIFEIEDINQGLQSHCSDSLIDIRDENKISCPGIPEYFCYGRQQSSKDFVFMGQYCKTHARIKSVTNPDWRFFQFTSIN